MKNNFTLLCITFLMLGNVYAQNLKFGAVSKEELKEPNYSMDASANAAILYKYRTTFLQETNGEVRLVTEIHKRIKIYNKQGFDYATQYIDLYKDRSSKEKATNIEAITYNLEGEKIIKTKLDKNQIFTAELSYNYNQTKFTLPNVKEGSVIEFKYKVYSPYYLSIDDVKFQYDIPIKKIHVDIRTPEGYNYKQNVKGFISFYPRQYTKMDNRLGMNVTVYEYKLADVPALKEESYVDNINNYSAGVSYELAAINVPGYYKSYTQTWEDIARQIGSTSDYKKELDKINSFDEEVDAVLQGKVSMQDKMNALLDYVKQNIVWNRMGGKFFFHGIKKALKEKKGNSADINLTLVAMLRYAGLDANPLVISTKNNGMPIFPTMKKLNHVIAYVEDGEQQYFLDATDPFSQINVLPVKNYNWRGLYINNQKKVWKLISIIQPQIATRNIQMIADLNEEGVLSGKVRCIMDNHRAMTYRKDFKNSNENDYLNAMESKYGGIEISEFSVKNETASDKKLIENFSFLNEAACDIIEDKIYLSPLQFFSKKQNPFTLEKREFPIDFGFPFRDKFRIIINLPEGYKVTSLPKSVKMKMPEALGSFTYGVSESSNALQISVIIDVKKAILVPQYYGYIKEYYNQIINKEAEKIILTKV